LVEVDRTGKGKRDTLPGFVAMHGELIPHRQFYAELLGHARERGYSDGWAAHQYFRKIGSWPKSNGVVPAAPSYEVASWIRSRQIAYAKARAKEAKQKDRNRA
jgi:hypothetical protein